MTYRNKVRADRRRRAAQQRYRGWRHYYRWVAMMARRYPECAVGESVLQRRP